MKKWVMIWTFLVILFSLGYPVYATLICDEQIDPNTDCLIVTPSGMDCNTYSIYNESGQKDVDDATMSVLSAEDDIYYATFNFASVGAYTITLCGNKTAFLTVTNRTFGDPLFSYTEDILDRVIELNSTTINVNASLEGLNETWESMVHIMNRTTESTRGNLSALDIYVRDQLNDDNLIYTALSWSLTQISKAERFPLVDSVVLFIICTMDSHFSYSTIPSGYIHKIKTSHSATPASNLITFTLNSPDVPIDVITFRGDGNVGIGTTAPTTKLDVVGVINITTATTPALQIGSGTGQVNITLFSPDGTAWNCGVDDTGAFSCN